APLKTTANDPLPGAPGMELEYWLEARDNCDYPDANGNVGASKHYKLTIGPPKDSGAAQQDRTAAQKQQGAHQKKQDQALADQKAQAEAEGGQGNGPQQGEDRDKLANDAK